MLSTVAGVLSTRGCCWANPGPGASAESVPTHPMAKAWTTLPNERDRPGPANPNRLSLPNPCVSIGAPLSRGNRSRPCTANGLHLTWPRRGCQEAARSAKAHLREEAVSHGDREWLAIVGRLRENQRITHPWDALWQPVPCGVKPASLRCPFLVSTRQTCRQR